MVVSTLQQVASPPDQIEAEAVAAFFFPEDRPLAGAAGLLDWRLNGFVSGLILDGKAVGEVGEQLWIRSNDKLRAPWVLLVGGGSRSAFADVTGFRKSIGHLLKVAADSGIGRLVIGIDPVMRLGQEQQIDIITSAWEQLGSERLQCLVSFDQSWVKNRSRSSQTLS
ncbi:MAG TPA: M17 family peptidase N-terminal domain-containing protein [Geothermobacteraceae bacterium]|nr:M17 family peptidase N-terminal domain-containing protein [Geothermobacteraceae bacterium]